MLNKQGKFLFTNIAIFCVRYFLNRLVVSRNYAVLERSKVKVKATRWNKVEKPSSFKPDKVWNTWNAVTIINALQQKFDGQVK